MPRNDVAEDAGWISAGIDISGAALPLTRAGPKKGADLKRVVA